MRSTTEIATRTLNLIKRYAPDEIDMDTPVLDLDIDSLAMFEIVYELEEANQAGADIQPTPPQSGD